MGRASGQRTHVDLHGLHDHCSWTVSSDHEFLRAAEQFLRAGVARGAKCVVVADAALRTDLTSRPWFTSDAVGFWPLEEFYARHEPVRADETIAMYEAATRDAVASGHSGLRVAADITTLVESAEQRTAFVEYEAGVDELMRRLPMSAMCSVDRRLLDPSTVTAMAAVHPSRRAGTSPFGCTAEREPGGPAVLTLTGEVDQFHVDALDVVLGGLADLDPGETTRIDISGLGFVDHQTLLALDGLARVNGHRFTLTGARPIVRRLVELLELTRVRADR